MKVILLVASVVALVVAEPPSGYSSVGGYSGGGGSSSFGAVPTRSQDAIEISSGNGVDNYVPQVYKHVYVHAAADEEPQRENRVIRVPGGDKHVNIIFVKTPSQSSQSQTEVVLPEQDEHKNLVYVLLKKQESESNIKITRPQPARPSKPEVHFIRYADGAATAQPQPEAPAPVYGTPADPPAPQPVRAPISREYGTPADVPAPQPVRTPSGLYGTPFQ
ncbi:unnamed protein product [Orchesella dallaii]|uniref:DUF243 domain-containing protein n=1 Tax=Orchesella dallaii TaxID=48710 RepID=A0ABP1RFD5_9HEXA